MYIDKFIDLTSRLNEQNTREKIFNILNLSVPILMSIFIFFVPFPHTTAIKEICFYGSVIIVLILTCFKKIDFSFKSPLTIPFALFTAWALIGLFFALDKGNSLHDFRAHLLKYLAIYYILINFFNSRKRLIILSWIIIISAAISSIGGLVYFYVILKNPISTRFGFSQQMMAIDLIGFVTIFAMLLSLRQFKLETNWYRKAILVVCLLGTFAATYLTMSRGSLGAVFIALIVFFVKKNKFAVIFLIIFSLIAVRSVPVLKSRLSFSAALKDIRVGINLTTLEIIKDYPITGIGFGMRTYGYSNFIDLTKYNAKIPTKYQQKTVIRSPHNSLACVAVRTGIVGVALFLFIYFIFVRLGLKIILYGKDDFIKDWGVCIMAAFIGVLIQELFADGMFGPQAIVLYTIFAFMTILWQLNTEIDTITA